MLARNSGRIINIASQLGQIGGVEVVHYSASKGGVIAFTRWLAKDAGRHGVRVNAVAPGPVHTEMTRGFDYNVVAQPISRMGHPDEPPTRLLVAPHVALPPQQNQSS